MSKGLGYDNVIVVNGKNETYGFPSKIQDDPVLKFVIKGDNSIDYAEERRLFYVAMTRTKNRVYFVAPEQNPSEFLLEIKKDYKNVVLKGSWNDNPVENKLAIKQCPICGYPMQYKYKNSYGLRLFICTNEPEVCGFMTNEYRAGKLSILKCECCKDGYLIVKAARGEYFLACTNYKTDGTGCNNTMSPQEYSTQKVFEEIIPDNFTNEYKQQIKQTTEKKENITPDVESSSSTNVNTKSKQDVSDYTKKIERLNQVMYKDYHVNELLHTTLNCLIHISENHYFNTETLVTVLNGGNSDKIKKHELYTVPEYRMLASMSYMEIIKIVNWALENHYILQTKERIPKLHPTYECNNYYDAISEKQLKNLKEQLEKK